MRIKSLPEKERPLEKAVEQGITSLTNTEILALIIHTGTRERSSIHLAEEVLAVCDTGISNLGSMGLEEYTSISGIGTAKACRIMAAVELGKRLATSRNTRGDYLDSAEDVAGMFMEELRYAKKEHFRTVLINTKGQVMSVDSVSVGELASTVVHPREVFGNAIRKSAAAVILVHNHPSGDPTPSNEDVRTTERLVRGGELLGIDVLDHIIIGDGVYCSFREMSLMEAPVDS
jgi:DNA repair protein RadC